MTMRVRAVREAVALAVLMGAVIGSECLAADPPQTTDREAPPGKTAAASLWTRDTLTDHGFGLGEALSEQGVDVSLDLTQVCQTNVNGGLARHRRSGRYAGSYDLGIGLDLERLLSLRGGSLFIGAEGSWSEGIDASSIGSLFGANADAGGDRSIDVTELYYEQRLLDERLMIRLGKVDVSGGFECRGCPASFDANSLANDETTQFLNGALVNNPQIPFPDNGLGVIVHGELVEWWYVSAGIGDAEADARMSGWNTAWSGPDYFFSCFETGVMPRLPSANGPLQGAYRLGLWYDPQPKARFDGSRDKRDDLGLYLSCDQVCLHENDLGDGQGLGVFFRCGFADGEVNEIKTFYSTGLQYRGLLPGRDSDVAAVGFATGRLTNSPGEGFTSSHETVLEAYYNVEVTPWLSISPNVQYIANPGGDEAVTDDTVVGVRIQLAF
ncbi:MAG: carbohydrate porin [Planctomycetes bacterium]|nr:carbohydrate porin [Planctomycetota bacterium]